MKRYRVLAYTFDTRSNILNMEISENWTPEVRNTWRRNKDLVRESLVRELGEENADDKLRNVTELGALPFSFLAFHNTFLRQSRTAFCVGAYYPALTSACALGERILNHLVIKLRDDFKHTAEYKSVYRKKSFDDWNKPIDALAAWNVLLPDVSETFNSLREQRNDSLHFRPDVDDNARELALKAIRTLSRIIEAQFGMASDSPWFIKEIAGAQFVRADCEGLPFVRRILIPACKLVGPVHRLEHTSVGWKVHELESYEDREIDDAEFARLYNESKKRRSK